MRDAAIAIIREIGVDTGGSNIQFAVHPDRRAPGGHRDEPARLAQLGAGQQGDRLSDRQDRRQARRRLHARRDPQRHHPRDAGVASSRPSTTWSTKIPRFTFEKFPQTPDFLTTQMKSVGEAMAIGRTFKESLQKAMRSLEIDSYGFDDKGRGPRATGAALGREAARARMRAASGTSPTPIAQGMTTERIFALSKIDPWFLENIREIIVDVRGARSAWRAGRRCAAPRRWASPTFASRSLLDRSEEEIRQARQAAGIRAGLQDRRHLRRRVRRPHAVSLLDLRGRGRERASTARKKIMILGGGPNRIGQGIEFDYCCVHAAFALKEAGLRDHHGELQPRDGQHRLRHLGQALLRAADARGRAEHRRAREARRGDRPVRRPDAAQARACRWRRRACRSSAPRPTPSTAPRTASASRRCSTSSACASRRTASR